MSSHPPHPADSLAALHSDGSPRHLVVDALNLLNSYFLPIDDAPAGTSAWTLLEVMQKRVIGFLTACSNTTPQLIPHFVIDAGWKTREAANKWRQRREKEVRSHKRGIPLSADTFLADALRQAGAYVYQVEGEDGDDIVVVLAHSFGDKSLVLSADRDMFRYDDSVLPNSQNRVAADFSFKSTFGKNNQNNQITVALHASPTQRRKDGVSMRSMADMPIFDKEKHLPLWRFSHSKLHVVISGASQNGYVRGACSPATRVCGNLHGILRPLRLAVYRNLGATGKVHERFPEWDTENDTVRWEDADIDVERELTSRSERSEFFDQLLNDPEGPKKALSWLREMDPSYTNAKSKGLLEQSKEELSFRGFARVAIVAECFAAVGDQNNQSVLSTALAMKADTGDSQTSPSSDSNKFKKTIQALFQFPPASRVSSKCSEKSCGVRFVIAAGERAFLVEKGFSLPTRCKPCRDKRKAKGVIKSPGGRGGKSSSTPSPTGVPLRLRTLRPGGSPKIDSLEVSDTAEKLAALSVS